MKKLVEIYVANLEAYNKGVLKGEWITLPKDEEILIKELKEIGGEEQAVHDIYDTIGLNLNEYTNIKKLNNFLKELDKSNYTEEIKALLEADYINLQELLKMDSHNIENFVKGFIIVYAGEDTKHLNQSAKIAYNYIDVFGGIEYMDKRTLENYFNYGDFGRDLKNFYYNYNEENEEIEKMSDMELAEHYINNVLGDIKELGRDTLENFFDYEYYGRDLQFKGVFASSNNLIIII